MPSPAPLILNPVLRGFHPDPSILRVGTDYYLATSTFEWWPGVNLHHSRDLVHWRLLGYALTRPSQLDLVGNPDSAGIWAPALSHDGDRFHLIFTNVRTYASPYKDAHNFLVTAPAAEGPWSDPIFLNSSGFDPSLFHDPNTGRKWLVNMFWDARPGRNAFSGIVLQEYSPAERRLTGPRRNIFRGTARRYTEAPHLLWRAPFYYLLTAEGGTVYEHAVTLARARELDGPWETIPGNHLLTSDGRPDLPLQKAGHGSLVETPAGEAYLAHLCGRPLPGRERCPLGRETALQRVEWTADGWLQVAGGGNAPHAVVPGPDLPAHPFPPRPERDDFDSPDLPLVYNSLRDPFDPAWCSLTARPGFLRLVGRESPFSRFRQSLVARRLQHFEAEAETRVSFAPEDHQQLAGIIAFYDVDNFLLLALSRDETAGRVLRLLHSENGKFVEPLGDGWPIADDHTPWRLKVTVTGERLRFFHAPDGGDDDDGTTGWQPVGPDYDLGQLSDENHPEIRFTGTFVGMAAYDVTGRGLHADFDYFAYREGAAP